MSRGNLIHEHPRPFGFRNPVIPARSRMTFRSAAIQVLTTLTEAILLASPQLDSVSGIKEFLEIKTPGLLEIS
jgi:hypothetical protein